MTNQQLAKSTPSLAAVSPWPQRMAIALTLVTFPLIWVGGLVTTQDAGMAVPDWPGTYGYNLFLYPIEEWWWGPWDLFIEHGHRLLGSLAGLITIGLVIAVSLYEMRRWTLGLAVLALVLVIAQGLLGGVRVLAADRAIALVHGCVGPAFFALGIAIATILGQRWRAIIDEQRSIIRPTDWAWTLGLVVLAYVQLVLGANLRHISVEADPIVYRTLVVGHVTGAILVVFHALRVAQLSFTGHLAGAAKPAVFVTALVIAQFLLGLGTWALKFGIPAPYGEMTLFAEYAVPAKSMLQANIVTAHVAIGSLVLGTSVWLMLIVGRQTAFSGTAAIQKALEARRDRLMSHSHSEVTTPSPMTTASSVADRSSAPPADGVLA